MNSQSLFIICRSHPFSNKSIPILLRHTLTLDAPCSSIIEDSIHAELALTFRRVGRGLYYRSCRRPKPAQTEITTRIDIVTQMFYSHRVDYTAIPVPPSPFGALSSPRRSVGSGRDYTSSSSLSSVSLICAARLKTYFRHAHRLSLLFSRLLLFLRVFFAFLRARQVPVCFTASWSRSWRACVKSF